MTVISHLPTYRCIHDIDAIVLHRASITLPVMTLSAHPPAPLHLSLSNHLHVYFLREWMGKPLCNREKILSRQEGVGLGVSRSFSKPTSYQVDGPQSRFYRRLQWCNSHTHTHTHIYIYIYIYIYKETICVLLDTLLQIQYARTVECYALCVDRYAFCAVRCDRIIWISSAVLRSCCEKFTTFIKCYWGLKR